MKICREFCENNITIKNAENGLNCKVSCPDCGAGSKEYALSSSRNQITGKTSFSYFNFERHYSKAHKNRDDVNDVKDQLNDLTEENSKLNMIWSKNVMFLLDLNHFFVTYWSIFQ